MRIGAAHEGQVQLAGQGQVVGVEALAAHQGRVFDAANGLAAAEACRFHGRVHAWSPAITTDACFTAATMLT